jgi:hypothetical protein
LTKAAPHLFLGQNGLFGAFWGKTISHKNFPPFCLLSPTNCFSEKLISGMNFFTKPHHNNYRGQMDYMARFVAKLFRSKVSCLRKSTFAFRIFLLNRPLSYFWGYTERLVRLGAKLFRTKTSLHFASYAPKISFLKNTFPVRIFLLNHTTITIGAKRNMWNDWGQDCSGAKLRVFEKARLHCEFFSLNRPLTYFWGKTDRLVCFGAKLFCTKTSLHFAS